jgi:hypothetical protein
MRTIHVVALAALGAAGAGCSESCGLASQMNGATYEAFIHPVGPWEVENASIFPAEASPGNGPVAFGVEWGLSNTGPITVLMDGQAFDGEGVFYEQECGNFEITWAGQYLSEVGSEHNFAARAVIQFYDSVLAGRVYNYSESWKFENQTGSYSSVQSDIFGEIVGGAATAN